MISLEPPFRLATPADAPALALFISEASEGLAPHFWARAVGAEAAPSHGVARMAAQAEAGRWIVADEGNGAVAGLAGYAIPAAPPPIPDDVEPIFRPLDELEHRAPGTWYVHVLATLPEARGRGWGTRLLALAERIATDSRHSRLSIIVSDANAGARRLYERAGFREAARRPMVKNGWDNPGAEWILMIRDTTGTASHTG